MVQCNLLLIRIEPSQCNLLLIRVQAGYNDHVTCPHYIYNFSQADYDGLLSYLLQYDFTSVNNNNYCSDIESAYLEFSTIIYQAIDRFVRSVETRRHKSPKSVAEEAGKSWGGAQV